jgi:hypothetical protein
MREDIFNGFYDKLDVKTRPGRGGNYPYVSADDVTDRMNKLFKGDWSSMVVSEEVRIDQTVVRVRVEVRDPESGHIYFHEGYGGQRNDDSAEAGNIFKSAYSKAIVSACRRWGVGLFIEGGDQPTTQTLNTAIGAVIVPAAAPAPGTGPAPGAPSLPPGAGVQSEEVKTPSVPQAPPTPPQGPPAHAPSIPKAAGIPWSKPPAADTVIPKVPGPAADIPVPTESAAPVETIDENKISDVQKISIESLVSMRGITYKEMAEGALQRVPDVGTLTHDEAVAVIQYGNYLYKKNKQK